VSEGRRLRIGLAGCGRWGLKILRDLRLLRGEVVVADPSDDARRAALGAGAADAVRGIDELPAVEGYVVATPATTHFAVASALLETGRPVYVEKPLATKPEEADRLAARGAGRLFVMDKWRYHPGVEALGAIARSGELGPVTTLRTTRAGWGTPQADVDGVWTLLPHELSVVLEVTGGLPTARSAVVEIVEGAPAGIVGVLGDRPPCVVEVSLRHAVYRREVRLHAEGGIAILPDPYADALVIVRGSGRRGGTPPTEQRAIGTEAPLFRELRSFVAHLAGGPPPRSSADEGALIVARASALRRLAGLD
jgi:predicted dehydrogenase